MSFSLAIDTGARADGMSALPPTLTTAFGNVSISARGVALLPPRNGIAAGPVSADPTVARGPVLPPWRSLLRKPVVIAGAVIVAVLVIWHLFKR